jgi:hypothetical protein
MVVLMWTVTVSLPNGEVENFSDSRRTSETSAWAYSYEVDSNNDTLRVFRTGQSDPYKVGDWKATGSREEVAYFRAHQWDRVRGE